MRHKDAQIVVGVVASGMFVAAMVVSLSGARQQAQAPPAAAAPPAAVPAVSPQRALLDKYCVTCHNDRVRAASLVMTSDKVDVDHVAVNAELWEKVARKVGSGAMPPARMPRPPAPALQEFVTGLETALDRASAAAPNPGSPVPHRLNRVEYTLSLILI